MFVWLDATCVYVRESRHVVSRAVVIAIGCVLTGANKSSGQVISALIRTIIAQPRSRHRVSATTTGRRSTGTTRPEVRPRCTTSSGLAN